MGQLYFRQLLAGRDCGLDHPVAGQMQNFVYLIGDSESRECMIVDPAWAVDDLVDLVEAEDMKLVGALATHYHADHVGGTMYGVTVEGLPRLMERAPCKVHPHKLESDGIRKLTGLDASDFLAHESADTVIDGQDNCVPVANTDQADADAGEDLSLIHN